MLGSIYSLLHGVLGRKRRTAQRITRASDVTGLIIDWKQGEKTLLLLLLSPDGAINRIGTGKWTSEDFPLRLGQLAEPLVPRIVSELDVDVLALSGRYVMRPIEGERCALAVRLFGHEGRASAFEFEYGSISGGNFPPALTKFIESAIEHTRSWYEGGTLPARTNEPLSR